MTEREQRVLALFYEERVEELTPAYLAYRLKIASSEAAELLDSLVRSGTLDLNFDAEGNISYRLPAIEHARLKRQPAPGPAHHATPYDDASLEAHFFGPTNPPQHEYAPQNHAPPPYHQQHNPQPQHSYRPPADPNGYDGTTGDFVNASAHATPYDFNTNPQYAHPPQTQHQTQHQPQPNPYQPRYHTGQYVTHQDQPHAPGTRPYYPAPNTHMVPYAQQQNQLIEVPNESNPSVAAFLSFLVVGGGQWYNGEYAKGAWMFIGCAISWLFLMGWIVTFWSIIDAYSVAKERRSLPR